MSYFTHEQIEEIRQRLGLVPQEKLEKSEGCFDWEKAKKNLIETDCGITLCRDDYFEGDKKHFTFDEALEIEEEAKKHGFRLPTVVDFEKLYAYYGVDEDGDDTLERFVNELNFTYAGLYNGSSLRYVGTYGVYWSSSVYSTSNSYNLYFSTTYVYPQNTNSKDYGYALKFIYEGEN